jgi:hypothetical protein
MKYLLMLCLLISPAAYGQYAQADYERMMGRFANFYNSDQRDSICAMFPQYPDRAGYCFWKEVNSDTSALEEYGSIVSWTWLGSDKEDEAPVRVFRVVYSKAGTKAMSFTLAGDHHFGTFRLITTSDEIERMLNKR